MDWHTVSYHKTLEKLNVDKEKGLSQGQAKTRIIKYGKNVLDNTSKVSFIKKLVYQLSDFMVVILIIAAVISFVTSFLSKESDYIDAIIILALVIINTVIGVLQESKAEKDIESLKHMATPYAKVLRNGTVQKINSENIVPGDIIILNSGDAVCADARIIKSTNLMVEQSALTGESCAVEKNSNEVFEINTPIADQKNMVFSGSVIERGNAVAVVVATGMGTQVGKIASLINQEKPAQTHLQKKLAVTGKITAICVMAVSLIVFVLGIMSHTDFMEIFMISISLAVAAIPEGLPAVVTIVLASGVRQMAKHNTIVRNLPAVETLGHASVICSDKTGTLTMNKMSVVEIQSFSKTELLDKEFAKNILTLSALCNNSQLLKKHGQFTAQGVPTENALIIAAKNCSLDKSEMDSKHERILEIPFDSERKIMTTVNKFGNEFKVITKGAPEKIFSMCSHYENSGEIFPLGTQTTKKIKNINKNMASRGLRVLAVAYKNENCLPSEKNLEKNLIFYGFIGMIDPLRPEAKKAVEKCKTAGIKVCMITGDHIETAKAIANDLGILTKNSKTITGEELNLLSDEQLKKEINSYSVFARVSPEHKVKIVKAFQANGEVVAMTGDGVNDAPALKAADIGCAMGKTGTDAARAAADMIITDDNFSTIVEAVRQGRGIFDNIKKNIHFLISTNMGEVMLILLGFLMRIPSPLLAIHLLWINLVTDAFPSLALGMDPIDKNIMNRLPLDSKKSFFANGLAYNIIVEGFFISAVAILSYTIGRVVFDIDCLNPIIGRTMAFLTLGLSQVLHSFNVQSKKSLLKTGILSNLKLVGSVVLCIILEIITVTVPSFSNFFKTQPLNFLQWLIVWLLALFPLVVSEIEKYFMEKSKCPRI